MLILGLSGNFSHEDVDLAPDMTAGFFHDATACLIRDGELLAAIEEERFNRIKKTTKFPINAIRACFAMTGVTPKEIDAVGHYFQEDTVDLALYNIYLRNPQLPIRNSRDIIRDRLRDAVDLDLRDERLIYAEHHMSHAMSSFIRSGMKEALVAVMDSRG
jgi:decarbamoylnovobiocin carbamoyltransferase/7-O-carbamoyltransferase